jgi:hypothetical protein
MRPEYKKLFKINTSCLLDKSWDSPMVQRVGRGHSNDTETVGSQRGEDSER